MSVQRSYPAASEHDSVSAATASVSGRLQQASTEDRGDYNAQTHASTSATVGQMLPSLREALNLDWTQSQPLLRHTDLNSDIWNITDPAIYAQVINGDDALGAHDPRAVQGHRQSDGISPVHARTSVDTLGSWKASRTYEHDLESSTLPHWPSHPSYLSSSPYSPGQGPLRSSSTNLPCPTPALESSSLSDGPPQATVRYLLPAAPPTSSLPSAQPYRTSQSASSESYLRHLPQPRSQSSSSNLLPDTPEEDRAAVWDERPRVPLSQAHASDQGASLASSAKASRLMLEPPGSTTSASTTTTNATLAQTYLQLVPGLSPTSVGGHQMAYDGVQQIGDEMMHVYEGNFVLPTRVQDMDVNPHWGLTKAGEVRRRAPMACSRCRAKKIRCDSAEQGCLQCQRRSIHCRP